MNGQDYRHPLVEAVWSWWPGVPPTSADQEPDILGDFIEALYVAGGPFDALFGRLLTAETDGLDSLAARVSVRERLLVAALRASGDRRSFLHAAHLVALLSRAPDAPDPAPRSDGPPGPPTAPDPNAAGGAPTPSVPASPGGSTPGSTRA